MPSGLSEHHDVSTEEEYSGDRRMQIMKTERPEYTDMRWSEWFAEEHAGVVRYCYGLGWLHYNGMFWERDTTGTVQELCKETVQRAYDLSHIADADQRKKAFTAIRQYDNQRARGRVIEDAKSIPSIRTSADQFDAVQSDLNTPMGTVDLKTGIIRRHDPNDLITRCTGADHRPNADRTLWENTLDAAFLGNAELIHFFKLLVGSAIYGGTVEQIVPVMHGCGANGKTTIIGTIQQALGSYAGTVAPETFLTKRSDGIRNDLARLPGIRFLVTSETGENRFLDEGMVKSVSGGEHIVCRYLHQEFFEFLPQFTLFIVTNHRPRVRGTDDAVWRRLRLIPFDRQFSPEEQDKELPSKLKEELPSVLAWCVEGCREWQESGLDAPDIVKARTSEYREHEDVVGTFLADCCVEGDGYEVGATKLYQRYHKWCDDNGERPASQKIFGGKLTDKGFKGQRTRAGIVRIGISVQETDYA